MEEWIIYSFEDGNEIALDAEGMDFEPQAFAKAKLFVFEFDVDEDGEGTAMLVYPRAKLSSVEKYCGEIENYLTAESVTVY